MAGRCSEPEPRSGKSCAAPLQAPSSSHAQAPSVPPSQVPGIPPSQALGVSQPALTTPQLTTPTEVDVEIQHRAAVVPARRPPEPGEGFEGKPQGKFQGKTQGKSHGKLAG